MHMFRSAIYRRSVADNSPPVATSRRSVSNLSPHPQRSVADGSPINPNHLRNLSPTDRLPIAD